MIKIIVNIKDFGAVGDGVTLNTSAIQKAIDTVGEKGGRVLIEDGIYMTGTIRYKSNVEIHIASDATLLGSPDCNDYPEQQTTHVNTARLPRFRNACLIFAENKENIALTGLGKIDCNGKTFVVNDTENPHRKFVRDLSRPTPPRAVFFTGCKNVKVEDITMVNQPAGWSYWVHDCDYVTFDKVKIDAHVDYPNNDGIHINSSRNITVSNCDITCGDDCIVVRANNASLKENKVCERVVINNCNLTSYTTGIRIGWINDGVIKNCAFSNIVMTDCSCGIDITLPLRHFNPENPLASDVGREATLIENLTFDSIVMDKTFSTPINIDISNDDEVKMQTVRNIHFSNIICSGPQFLYIRGKKENHVRDIEFNNCSFTLTNGDEFPDKEHHGSARHYYDTDFHPMTVQYADNIRFNNTSFNVK